MMILVFFVLLVLSADSGDGNVAAPDSGFNDEFDAGDEDGTEQDHPTSPDEENKDVPISAPDSGFDDGFDAGEGDDTEEGPPTSPDKKKGDEAPDSGFDERWHPPEDDVTPGDASTWSDEKKVIFPVDAEENWSRHLSLPDVLQTYENDFRYQHKQFLRQQSTYIEQLPQSFTKKEYNIGNINLEVKYVDGESNIKTTLKQIKRATEKLVEVGVEENWSMPQKIRVALLKDSTAGTTPSLSTQGRAILTRDGAELQVILGDTLRVHKKAIFGTQYVFRGGLALSHRGVSEQYSEYKKNSPGSLFFAGVLHEYGHGIHSLNSPSTYWHIATGDNGNAAEWSSRDERNIAYRHVSQYAGKKERGGILEFVAEFFAGKMMEMPFTAESTALYEKYGGPSFGETQRYQSDANRLQLKAWPFAPLSLEKPSGLPSYEALISAYESLGASPQILKNSDFKQRYTALFAECSKSDGARLSDGLKRMVENELQIIAKAKWRAPGKSSSYWALRDMRDRFFMLNVLIENANYEVNQALGNVSAETLKTELEKAKRMFQDEAKVEPYSFDYQYSYDDASGGDDDHLCFLL